MSGACNQKVRLCGLLYPLFRLAVPRSARLPIVHTASTAKRPKDTQDTQDGHNILTDCLLRILD